MAHEGPTCVYVASYDDRASADLDLVAVKQLHANGEISGFDAAIMQRDDKGHVHIHKDETGTHVGACCFRRPSSPRRQSARASGPSAGTSGAAYRVRT